MNRFTIIALLLFGGAGCAPQAEQAPEIDHAKLQGVWQLMTMENLETGEVDSIGAAIVSRWESDVDADETASG